MVTAVAAPATAEWWELVRDQAKVWLAAHDRLVRVVRLVWLGCLLIGLAAVAVSVALFSNVREAMSVYISVAWLLICGFLLARTKTLTLGAFSLLYGICMTWAVGIQLVELRVTAWVSAGWPLQGASTFGPSVGIAAVTEESLKLLPLGVLVLLAPGRARRFAAVDWLLLGLAAGAGFRVVEEGQRRLSMSGGGYGGVLDTGVVEYAGHHVLTGLVAAGVGLAIVVWRAAGRLRLPARLLHRVGAVGLPLLLFWVAIADHVVLNADSALPAAGSGSEGWLQPASTVPLAFRWWYAVGGHGHGRAGLLVMLFVISLLCDASRAPARDWWTVVPAAQPGWADRAVSWCQSRLGEAEATGPARPLRDGVVAVVTAAVALFYVVARDLAVGVAAHARVAGESRWDAMLRGRAVLVMQRETRELAAEADASEAGSRRWVYRTVAAVAVVVLLSLALVVGAHAAASLGWDLTFAHRWLAGLFDGLAGWWSSLSPGQQLLLTVALAAALAIPFGFGLGLFLAGGLTYMAAHGRGVASLLRDPRGAISSYFQNRSLGGMAFDAGELALTFVPAGLGSAGGVAVKAGVRSELGREAERYLADPAAWRAARRVGERGEARLPGFGARSDAADAGATDAVVKVVDTPNGSTNGLSWATPEGRQAWVDAAKADPEYTRVIAGKSPAHVYQRTVVGDPEVQLGRTDPTQIWADGIDVDPDKVVAVEAKYVVNSARSMYEGHGPAAIQENLMEQFDNEMRRYALNIRDTGTPVARLRIVTNTQAAAAYLGARAERILGSGIDLRVIVETGGQ